MGSSPGRFKPKTINWQLLLLLYARSIKEKEQRLVDLLGIRIMYMSEVKMFLPVDCCISELALQKSNKACWSSPKGISLSSFKMLLVQAMI